MAWNDNDGGFQGVGPRDPREVLNELKERFSGGLPGGILGGAFLIGLLLWAATGFYIVNPDEVGVVKRFGQFSHIAQPGPHWHLPAPVESVIRQQVTVVHRVEVGFRTLNIGPPAQYRKIPAEAHMLTKDENIVSCEFIVQYKIEDPYKFLFHVKDPEGPVQWTAAMSVVRDAAEAAMREVVGSNSIDDVLTENKDKIQSETTKLLQEILSKYDMGIKIDVNGVKLQDVYPPEPVIAAFRDVASAREDRARLKNEAEAFANNILPRARGEAKKLLNEAEAFKETKIKTAQGDVARFLSLFEEYDRAKDITRKRLHLEAMGKILSKTKVVLMDENGGRDVLPILPLKALDAVGGN